MSALVVLFIGFAFIVALILTVDAFVSCTEEPPSLGKAMRDIAAIMKENEREAIGRKIMEK